MSGLNSSPNLTGIEAIAPNDVWAVGNGIEGSTPQTFAAHWDGTTWTQVYTPNRGNGWSRFFAVEMVTPSDLWAVGNRGDNGTLVERYFSWPCLTPTPLPTTNPCALQFEDVPPDHTFYANIRCLACREVLGGYSDGTFRPGNNITRGQIAKVVSNAAGFNEPLSEQTFEDVPTNSTFYVWIERLTGRGVMGGYPCGTVPQEPCNPPENRPYFRPFSNATRGQLSKIVANTAGLSDPVEGLFYTDVPDTNPFYTEIMRLTVLGVMSGYPCGSPGELCDTENRPYFRWGNPVTRGQASKIVANTFFPGCATP